MCRKFILSFVRMCKVINSKMSIAKTKVVVVDNTPINVNNVPIEKILKAI